MMSPSLRVLAVVWMLGAGVTVGVAQSGTSGESSPLELFELRIMPIFNSPNPSSCVQCHLASVDLKEYILPSHEQTFASLRDQGLIDLNEPENSKILTLIRMGEKDLDTGAHLIHEQAHRAEYEAFAAWITACCNDTRLRTLPQLASTEQARPDKSDEVIRHSRKSRVVDSFVRNVWSQRMRCFPCHTPYEFDENNSVHQTALKKHQEFEAQHPELVARMKIFRETPEETLQYLIDKSRATSSGQYPLLNLENPRESLLVLKPMSKLPVKDENGEFGPPSSVAPVSHLGGLKMHPDDQSYKSFVAWIQDYANVVGGRYASVGDLPADNWYASKHWLKVTAAPETWPVETPVQMFVHAWNDEHNTWATEPIAFTQGTVTPQHLVNGTLFLLAPQSSTAPVSWDREQATLPPGRYLVKVYLDTHHRLADDPGLLLGDDDFVGQAELNKAHWREDFRSAESISGKSLSRQ